MNQAQIQSTFLIGIVLLAAGCRSGKVARTQYTSPKVVGRTVDARTGQPIAQVKIRRLAPGQSTQKTSRGAEQLRQPRPIFSDQQGRFVVDSESTLNLLGGSSWYSVTLAFSHRDYQQHFADYDMTDVATNLPSAEPVVDAEDIFLEPVLP